MRQISRALQEQIGVELIDEVLNFFGIQELAELSHVGGLDVTNRVFPIKHCRSEINRQWEKNYLVGHI